MGSRTGLRIRPTYHRRGYFRSWMFIPADKPQFLKNIPQIAADVYVIDFEDAVLKNKKDGARNILKDLQECGVDPNSITIRINHLATRWGMNDLEHVVRCGIRRIMYPKLRLAAEIPELIRALEKLGVDVQNKDVEIVPIIETLPGFRNSRDILALCSFASYVVFGSEDFLADVGVSYRGFVYDNPLLCHALVKLAIECAEEGKHLIDCATPFFSTTADLIAFRKECEFSSHLGAVGKLAIHPNQVEIINEVFGLAEEELKNLVRDAGEIARLMAQGDQSAIRFNDRLVGIPEVRKYIKQLEALSTTSPELKKDCETPISLLKEILHDE